MKKYLLTVLSVVFSITLMGQQNPFTIGSLTYTIISGTNNVKVKKKQDESLNNIHVVIPDSVTIGSNTYAVTEIENQAFQHSSDMTGVTIPNTVKIIGEYAFENAGNNKAEFVVNMGSGVVTIKTNAFHNCQKLKYIRIPSSCSSIEAKAFEDCQSLVEMHIPNPNCTLGAYAFAKCRNLQAVTLPNNITSIPEGLLMNCDNHLREIIIPENVTSIGSQAFAQVHDAQIIFLGCGDAEGKITIADNAFMNNQRDDVEFFCTEIYGTGNNTRSVQFVNAQGGAIIYLLSDFNNTTLFGTQLDKLYVPCGMENVYAQGLLENPDQTSKINEGELCLAVTRQDGDFCDPATWRGYIDWNLKETYEGIPDSEKENWLKQDPDGDGPLKDRWPNFVPRKPMQPFVISYEKINGMYGNITKDPHEVTLKHRRDIYPFNSVNNGRLIIDATGDENHYGQLIERDSVLFDANITLNVTYEIKKYNNTIYLIKDYPINDSTNITSLLNGSETTEGNYKKERGYIRDTKTRYLLSITPSNNGSYDVEEKDTDYYEIHDDGFIHYYGGADDVFAKIEDLTTDPDDNNGFYKESGSTLIKHEFTYNEDHTATATIDGSTGDVTLRGTDYTYGHVRMHQNISGEIYVKVPAVENKWNFVGAPFNVYDLYAVRLHNGLDASAVRFNYEDNDWDTFLSYGEDTVRPGEGFLAWPFYEGGITFSTTKDYGSFGGLQEVYADFVLNNDTVYVEKDIADNKWMALANPYPAKLCVNAFVSDNTTTLSNSNPDPAQSNTTIQGQGVYILNAAESKWEFKPKTNPETENGYDLGVGQGFFVNVANNATNKRIMFTKSQIHEYLEPQCQHGVNHSAKSSSQRGFIRLSMIADNVASELLFAHNEDAQQYYDIYDANKLFAMERMTEPYFVTDGIKLVKEEVKEVPYYATMNVRSYEEKEVKFRADYIPEGYAVSIIDGEETIDLNPGVEYTTEVSVGENANRFKVLVKKSVGLNDVEELAIDITNSNRIVNISTNETNLQIEVYNALGQKVLSTHSLNFSLNEVSAGAYMIKAFNSKGSKTQKIIIK
jgi:hypothetical protein